jgi:hypothetical protein
MYARPFVAVASPVRRWNAMSEESPTKCTGTSVALTVTRGLVASAARGGGGGDGVSLTPAYATSLMGKRFVSPDAVLRSTWSFGTSSRIVPRKIAPFLSLTTSEIETAGAVAGGGASSASAVVPDKERAKAAHDARARLRVDLESSGEGVARSGLNIAGNEKQKRRGSNLAWRRQRRARGRSALRRAPRGCSWSRGWLPTSPRPAWRQARDNGTTPRPTGMPRPLLNS